ncbi:MAG: hypothetical protein ACOZAO_02125 [Patescibacteria group bacterium]
MKNISNQKGISGIIMLVIVLALAVGGAVILNAKKSDLKGTLMPSTKTVTEENVMEEETEMEFTELEESSSTPEEVDNETVKELDDLMLSIEAESEAEAAINDIEL